MSANKYRIITRVLTVPLMITLLTSCATVGPDYERPEIDVPTNFKESNQAIDQQDDNAIQNLDSLNESWWTVYEDDVLDNLLKKIEVSNYSIQAAISRLQQARSALKVTKAGQSPSLVAGGTNDLGILLSWEIDLWGKIKRDVESNKAATQASEADLAAAKLSLQSQLAQNYFLLRVEDADIQLLQETSQAYQRSLEITQNQYDAGVLGRENLTQAQTQLSNIEVLIYQAQITRAQLEHNIAVMIGLAPSEFELATSTSTLKVPTIPVSFPSQLLLRRPDIAAAERRMASANAQIGVAKARAYPSLSLSAGYRVINKFVGGSQVGLPLYGAGAIKANSEKAAFAYDETVADYRQAVLTSFLEVEDNLVELDLLEKAAKSQAVAVTANERSEEILNNQYRAGIVNYQSIIIVQASSLDNQRRALDILSRRLTSSVALIKALGGGWDAKLLENTETEE